MSHRRRFSRMNVPFSMLTHSSTFFLKNHPFLNRHVRNARLLPFSVIIVVRLVHIFIYHYPLPPRPFKRDDISGGLDITFRRRMSIALTFLLLMMIMNLYGIDLMRLLTINLSVFYDSSCLVIKRYRLMLLLKTF